MKGRKTLEGIKKAILSLICISLLFLCVTLPGRADGEASSALPDTHAKAIERMRAGFEAYEQSIDISDLSITPEELGELFSHATKDTPYLFYVSSTLAFTYYTNGCVITVKPKYNMEKEEAEKAIEYCKSEVKKIAALIGPFDSELDILVAVHDLLCRDFSYDLTLKNDDIHSFLTQKNGTCQGYTWAYMALLRELGIECRYVASDTIAHIWLAVKIDGEWYHSDVTWDDPPRLEENDEISRAHILFSDEKADRDGYKDRYSSEKIKCESKLYDDGEKSLNQNVCLFSGDTDHDGKVSIRDLLFLRQYLEKGIDTRRLCLICSDIDNNYVIDETDVEHIRQTIVKRD